MEVELAEQLDKVVPNYVYKCQVCKVDVPCEHQIDHLRMEGFNEGFRGGISDRVEMYGALLHDEDFENYQPWTVIEPRTLDNPDYVLGLLEATCEEYRALWIRSRLTEYLGIDWQRYTEKIMDAFERCTMLAKIAHSQGSKHRAIPYLLQL